MKRAKGAVLLAAAILMAACGGSDGIATSASSTLPTEVRAAVDLPESEPNATTAPASTTDPSATIPDTTAPITTLLSTVPGTTAPSTTAPSTTTTTVPDVICEAPGEWVTTPSGRRVLLRADNIERPAPTVIVIHGYTGTPTGIERVSDMTNAVRGTGIAVAYPEGSPVEGLDGAIGWNTGAGIFASTGTDDVAALAEMIDALVATGCVDPTRLTLAGESNGGGMTLTALCSPALSSTFRTAVMVIPAVDQGVLDRCGNDIAPATPLTVVAGLIDRTTPFDGGNELLPQPVWFAEVNARRNCDGVAAPTPLTDRVDRIAAPDCAPCTELLVVSDGPHTWPGTPVGNGNLTPGTFDLNRRIIADVLDTEPLCISAR